MNKQGMSPFDIEGDSFFHLAGVMFVVLDNEGRVRRINEKGCEILGYSEKDIVGKNWFDHFLPQRYQKEVKKVFQQLMSGKIKPVEYYENPVLNKSGQERIIVWHNAILKDEKNSIVGTLGSGEDITERKLSEIRCQEQEMVLSDILEYSLSGYWDWNIPANTEYLSPAFKKMFGYEDHELPNLPETWQKLIFPEDLPGVLEVFDKHVKSHGREPYYNEVRYRHKNGSTIWVICAGRVIEWAEDGSPVRMIGCHVDITKKKQVEEALRESEEKFRNISESSPLGMHMYQLDSEGNLVFIGANPAADQLLGVDNSQFIGKTIEEAFPPLIETEVPEKYRLAAGSGIPWQTEQINYEDKEIKGAFEVRAFQISPGKMVAMFLDITERKKREEEIKKHLREKEILLKEVHHRVKNNLSVITSLLSIQARLIKNKQQAIEAFQESRNRIFSMALVHEKLYKSDNYANVNMKDYIEDMSHDLLHAVASKTEVALSVDAHNVFLDVNHAIPCGLILNELITNALKHAFPNRRKGSIQIGLKKTNHIYELTVRDDGVGLADDFDIEKAESMGLQIVILLTKQLEGKIKMNRGKGTAFQVTFPIPEL